MENDYKAVVVGNVPDEGIFFAKRSNSRMETLAILGREIVRLLNDYNCEVTINKEEDGLGKTIIVAKYKNNENSISSLEYKVLIEE